MAIAVGDIVAMKIIGNGLSVSLNLQPPTFGVAQTAGAGGPPETFNVLWENGDDSSAVVTTTIDRIVDPTGASLMGQIVFVSGVESPAYDAIVVNQFRRDPNGSGMGISADHAVIRELMTDTYREVLSSTLLVRTGR